MAASAGEPKEKVTVGFVYVGPTGDHGWTYRHDIGRQQVEAAYGDRVETRFVESVAYGADATQSFYTNGYARCRHYFWNQHLDIWIQC